MSTYAEVAQMLRRQEPLTREEWVKILEYQAEALLPIFKATNLPRLWNIEVEEGDRFFNDDEQASKAIQTDQACERGPTTEGIFFFADKSTWIKNGEGSGVTFVASILGLTRNGQWVSGAAKWTETRTMAFPSLFIYRKIEYFYVQSWSISKIDTKQFPTLATVRRLQSWLKKVVERKKEQLKDVREVQRLMKRTIRIAVSIDAQASEAPTA